MTLLTLFKNEIETTDDMIDASQDPAICGFLQNVIATAPDNPLIPEAERAAVIALAQGPGRPESRDELIERIGKLAPYLPSLGTKATSQAGASDIVAEPVVRIYLRGVSAEAVAGNLTPAVSL